MDEVKTFGELLESIEKTYSDDIRVKTLLIITAKAAYVMGQMGL